MKCNARCWLSRLMPLMTVTGVSVGISRPCAKCLDTHCGQACSRLLAGFSQKMHGLDMRQKATGVGTDLTNEKGGAGAEGGWTTSSSRPLPTWLSLHLLVCSALRLVLPSGQVRSKASSARMARALVDVVTLYRRPWLMGSQSAKGAGVDTKKTRPRILSGVQPSGPPPGQLQVGSVGATNLHLGNYVGAFRQWVVMQHEFESFHPVVDLHAITLAYDPEELADRTLEVAAILLACGLDPKVSTVFVQSHVPEHTELAWLFNHLATVGELRRMTQFKAKAAERGEGALPAGYFNYPVLQAADILIYQADRVPVGEDQRQHLELTRDLAERFNARFGETFVVPEAYIPKVGARVMDLQVPNAKMSKSIASPAGRINLLDPPEVIRRKVRSAVTDSGREVLARPDKPAISNLLELFSVVTGSSVGELEQAYAGRGYGDFKSDLADAIVAFLAPVQDRYRELRDDQARLTAILERGAAKAQAIARENLTLARSRMGLLQR
jgi:tryptophanyl-tRNA synthetase